MDAITIPLPADIKRRIEAHQQALRELRRLYRLSRAAERAAVAEQRAVEHKQDGEAA